MCRVGLVYYIHSDSSRKVQACFLQPRIRAPVKLKTSRLDVKRPN